MWSRHAQTRPSRQPSAAASGPDGRYASIFAIEHILGPQSHRNPPSSTYLALSASLNRHRAHSWPSEPPNSHRAHTWPSVPKLTLKNVLTKCVHRASSDTRKGWSRYIATVRNPTFGRPPSHIQRPPSHINASGHELLGDPAVKCHRWHDFCP